MSPLPFLQGCLVGVSIAAPVGPIGVLCIRRALTGGWLLGLATGLGAAVADALYGTVAALGLGAVSEALLKVSGWVGILGGCPSASSEFERGAARQQMRRPNPPQRRIWGVPFTPRCCSRWPIQPRYFPLRHCAPDSASALKSVAQRLPCGLPACSRVQPHGGCS